MVNPSLYQVAIDLSTVLDRTPLAVLPDIPVLDAIAQMHQADTTCILVAESDGASSKPIGILTENDLTRLIADQTPLAGVAISTLMTQPLLTFPYNQAVTAQGINFNAILHQMQHYQIRHLPIVDDDGMLVGLVCERQLVQALQPHSIHPLPDLPDGANLYRVLIDNFPNGTLHLFDRDFRFRIAGGLGIKRCEYIQPIFENKHLHDVFSRETVDFLEPFFQGALAGIPSDFEAKYEGIAFQAQLVPVKNQHGEVIAGLMITQDISEEKALELEQQQHENQRQQSALEVLRLNAELEQRVQARTRDLQDKEQFLQLVLDNIPQQIFWKDRNSIFLGCNRNWARQARIENMASVIGKTDYDLCPTPEIAEHYRQQDQRIMATDTPEFHCIECKPQHDGQSVWLDVSKVPIHDAEGNVIGILGTIENITERKRAELALQEAEAKYRSIFENATEGIFQSTPDGRFLSINPALAAMHGYATPAEMMADITDIAQQIYVESRDRTLFQQRMQQETGAINFEYQVYRRDRVPFWISENVRAIRDDRGQLLYYEGTSVDISERKRLETEREQAENQLKTSLQEKDVLLKEIHHRVKNNLQIIFSLLDLQSQTVEDPTMLGVLHESCNRIKSMALVHEQLYCSEEFSKIDFSEYIQQLTTYLSRSYCSTAIVEFQIDLCPISLNINTAIPWGLIINELVSNALKYAFPDRPHGQIRITCQPAPDRLHHFWLEIWDNGIGIPADFDINQSKSLGLQLVYALVDQLEASFTLHCDRGTRCRIGFQHIE